MKTSDKGISLIKRYESYSAKAYKCPAGVWTIGWGHTLGVKEGDTCNVEQATKLLMEDIARAEKAVPHNIPQSCFDALVSFAFNLGNANLSSSTLLRKVKANHRNPTIRDEFMRWVYCKKVVLPGLVRRRKEEADLYYLDL
ncbi:MAG: lysozyme [Tannerellaceae bacterium]